MSLDLYLMPPHEACPTCGQTLYDEEKHWRNITHNVRSIAQAAGADPWEWDDRIAADTLPDLTAATEALSSRPADFEHLRPSNGWGSVEGTLNFLWWCRANAEANPTWKWSVSR